MKTEEYWALFLWLQAPGITVQNLGRIQNEEQSTILNRNLGRKGAAVLEAVVCSFEPRYFFYCIQCIIYKNL